MNIKDSLLLPVSKEGFLLGAALALAAGAVKIVVLDGLAARGAAREAERESFRSEDGRVVAGRV